MSAPSMAEVGRTWDRFVAAFGHVDPTPWADLTPAERLGAAATYDDMVAALANQFEDVPF